MISPFLCPTNASYQIDYLDDRFAQITFTSTDTAEIVAAMPGVVRSAQDLGEDEGVSMTISYLDGSIAHCQHLSHSFWLSSNVEFFYSGQLIGYAKSDTEDSASFQYTLELPDNRVIAQDELFANPLFCSRKINVFPISDSMELFSMDKRTEINQLAIQSEAFKLYASNKTPRSEAVGVVSEIFGNKMHSFSVSTSSHDMHTIYLEQTETGFIANRCYEIDTTLQGIAQTAYSAVLDLGISIGINDEKQYQSLILSIASTMGNSIFMVNMILLLTSLFPWIQWMQSYTLVMR